MRKLLLILLLFSIATEASSQGSRGIKSGTGFFINNNGYLVTNEHVVNDCSSINVKGDYVPLSTAKLVRIDKKVDLALLKVNIRPKYVAPLKYARKFKIGEDVMVIGYPGNNGATRNYQMRMASILKVDNYGENEWIAISNDLQNGNSGGPLLDKSGNVIGVATATISRINNNDEVIESFGAGVNISILKNFLNKSFVNYKRLYAYSDNGEQENENKASKFIVSVHCVL